MNEYVPGENRTVHFAYRRSFVSKGSRALITTVIAIAWHCGSSLPAAADGPGYSQAPEVVMSERAGAASVGRINREARRRGA